MPVAPRHASPCQRAFGAVAGSAVARHRPHDPRLARSGSGPRSFRRGQRLRALIFSLDNLPSAAFTQRTIWSGHGARISAARCQRKLMYAPPVDHLSPRPAQPRRSGAVPQQRWQLRSVGWGGQDNPGSGLTRERAAGPVAGLPEVPTGHGEERAHIRAAAVNGSSISRRESGGEERPG